MPFARLVDGIFSDNPDTALLAAQDFPHPGGWSFPGAETARRDGHVPPGMRFPEHLHPLLAAECAAEAHAGGAEAEDLEQSVWLRWLECVYAQGPPASPADWLRAAVRAEVRSIRRRNRREVAYDPTEAEPAGAPEHSAEWQTLARERRRVVRGAIGRLPGGCPRLLSALLSHEDPTYREIAGELGISQGSLGPLRSRCLGCLRRMLPVEVGIPEPRGRVR
jgi:RNA polymerase sigma factor (sigma-70 family)